MEASDAFKTRTLSFIKFIHRNKARQIKRTIDERDSLQQDRVIRSTQRSSVSIGALSRKMLRIAPFVERRLSFVPILAALPTLARKITREQLQGINRAYGLPVFVYKQLLKSSLLRSVQVASRVHFDAVEAIFAADTRSFPRLAIVEG